MQLDTATEIEILKKSLHYDPDSGVLLWKENIGRKIKSGSVAGTMRGDGYVQIGLGGKTYYAHRIAFLLMTGRWPVEIDHWDRVRSHNWWSNLRECEHRDNMNNRVGWGKYPKGISKNSTGKFVAQINKRHLGVFERLEDALEARAKAALVLHGKFANVI